MSMTRRGLLAGLGSLLVRPGAGWAQDSVHGADSLFARPDIKLGWAVDRGPADGKPRVVVRLLNPQGAYRYLRVDGVDPFTKDRAVFVEPMPLAAQAEVAIPRDRFADHPSTEFHLFADEAAMRADKAALVVYYLGVPDTTPELPTIAGVHAYFDRMLK